MERLSKDRPRKLPKGERLPHWSEAREGWAFADWSLDPQDGSGGAFLPRREPKCRFDWQDLGPGARFILTGQATEFPRGIGLQKDKGGIRRGSFCSRRSETYAATLAGAAALLVSNLGRRRPSTPGQGSVCLLGLLATRMGKLSSRCARLGRFRVVSLLNWLLHPGFSPGPPFELLGQWDSPLRTPRLLGHVEHLGTRSRPLERSLYHAGRRSGVPLSLCFPSCAAFPPLLTSSWQ